MEYLRELLEKKEFFEALSENDNTFLHIFLNQPDIELDLLKLLLEKGLDVNAKNKFGYSPLQYAVCNPYCSVDVIKILLENGADIDHKDNYGNSTLHHILRKSDYEATRLLIEKGADVNIVNNDGDCPLNHAIDHSKWRVWNMFPNLDKNDNATSNAVASKLDILKVLLDRHPDLDIKNNFGDSPLHYGVNSCTRKRDLIRLLLRRGANLDLTNNCGDSCLHRAVNASDVHFEIVKLLLDYGAQVNAKNNCGDNPLCLAVQNPGCLRHTLKLLLDRGANVLACDKSGNLPLKSAILDYERDETTVERVELLLKYTLATSLGFDLGRLTRNTKHRRSLSKFAAECTLELIAMGSEKVALVKYPEYGTPVVVTLYEFMLGYQALPPLPSFYHCYVGTWRNEKKVVQSDIDDVLGILNGKRFPLFKEMIAAKVKRKDMIVKLTKQLVFTVRGEDMVLLDFYSVYGIAQFLPNDDLLNWITAYDGALVPDLLISRVPNTLLGKRQGQEIERCVKRYKKTKQTIVTTMPTFL